MPNTQWYYTDAQHERQGPLATAQMKQLFAEGGLAPSALVWRAGMEQWQPVQDFALELAWPEPAEGKHDGSNPYAAPAAVVGEPSLALMDDTLKPYADFVGSNFDKYRRKWHLDAKHPHAKDTWHWPAFCFGLMWMLYRKMYLLAVMWGVGSLLLSTALRLMGIPDLAAWGVSIGIAVAAGGLGNAFYLKHAQKQIQQVASANTGGAHALRAQLRLRGGTSIAAVFTGIFVMIVINVTIAFTIM